MHKISYESKLYELISASLTPDSSFFLSWILSHPSSNHPGGEEVTCRTYGEEDEEMGKEGAGSTGEGETAEVGGDVVKGDE